MRKYIESKGWWSDADEEKLKTTQKKDVLKAFPGALFHTLPTGSPLFPTLSSEYTSLANADGGATVTDKYLLSALHQARLTKDKAEFELIAQANAISSRAHETVMRVLGQGVKHAIKKGKGAGVDRPLLPGEWLIEKEAEAEALFVASCRREGCVSQPSTIHIVHRSRRPCADGFWRGAGHCIKRTCLS